MSMLEWAEREVKIASERERGGKPESEWDYGVACYESALKAYKCLCEDGHSGASWGFTVGILSRLCKGYPLTPIEDTEDVWNEIRKNKYQCNRMSSLFKDVAEDGTVTYSDVDRVCCVNCNSGVTYHSGLIDRLINSMYPIQMPYAPQAPYKVYCEDFLTDRKNGDFDTVGIYYMIAPTGDRVEINRYFKECSSGWEEISGEEYTERQRNKII